jgi:hypothetical protein
MKAWGGVLSLVAGPGPGPRGHAAPCHPLAVRGRVASLQLQITVPFFILDPFFYCGVLISQPSGFLLGGIKRHCLQMP